MPEKKTKLKPKERRLLRDIQKKEKNKAKNIRLVARVTIPDSSIRVIHKPVLGKDLRSKSAGNYKSQRLTWCITEADLDGVWGWAESRQWTDDEYSRIIEPRFAGYKNNTWGQVEEDTYNGKNEARRRLNKGQPLNSLCDEAQDRWLENDKLAIYDTPFRFRLGTDRRVWGIRIQTHFFAIWYERYHKICPIDD